MSETFYIAVYGAVVSTVLAALTIYNFIKDRKILRVEKQMSFGQDSADYNFIVSNISARPFTIIDCSIVSFSRTSEGKLEFEWGTAPKKIKGVFSDDEPTALDLPIVLHPGEVLLLRATSQDIIEQLRFNKTLDIGPKWTPTKKMALEITHSMSKNVHLTSFELEGDELTAAFSGRGVA